MNAKEARTKFMELFKNNLTKGSQGHLPIMIHKVIEYDDKNEVVVLIKLTAFLGKDDFIETLQLVDSQLSYAYIELITDYMTKEEFQLCIFDMDCKYEKGHGIRVRFHCSDNVEDTKEFTDYIKNLFPVEEKHDE